MSDVTYEGRKRRYDASAQRPQYQLEAQKRRAAYEITVPSHISTGSTPTVIDDFESGSLDAYTGDKTAFSADSTTPVFNGSFSLKCATAESELISTSGLNAYLDGGQTMAVQAYGELTSRPVVAPQVAYFVQDINNFYLAEFVVGNDILRLYRKQGGGFTALASASVVVGDQTEYQLRVTPATDGTHTIRLMDAGGDTELKSISTIDTTYTDGGIGFRQGNTGKVAFDYMRLL